MNPDRTDDWPDERRDGIWPRVYRPTRGQRLFVDVMGAVLLAIGLGFLGAALLWGLEKEDAVWIVFGTLVGLCFAIFGACCIVEIRNSRVLLFEDAIEVELRFGRRRLRRDEIAGLRIIPMEYGFQQFVFELHRPERKPVKTNLYCERDAVLCDWLAALPNLDALDRERAERELLRRPELGRTEEDRRQSLAKGHRIACAVTGLTLAAAVWGWFYPQPYTAAIVTLAAIPLVTVALFLAGRGRYATWDDREVRPFLGVPLILPGLVLANRALQDFLTDFPLVDWQLLLLWAVLGALALTALVVVGDPKLHRRWFAQLGMLLLLVAHPWGALLMANAILDRSEPERFRVAVLDKHICPSSEGDPSHHLRLAPWGPVPGREVTVDRELYQAVEVAGTVCVVLRSGALGVRWFYVQACDGSGLNGRGQAGGSSPKSAKTYGSVLGAMSRVQHT